MRIIFIISKTMLILKSSDLRGSIGNYDQVSIPCLFLSNKICLIINKLKRYLFPINLPSTGGQ